MNRCTYKILTNESKTKGVISDLLLIIQHMHKVKEAKTKINGFAA